MIALHNANPFRWDWQPNILIRVSASHSSIPKWKHFSKYWSSCTTTQILYVCIVGKNLKKQCNFRELALESEWRKKFFQNMVILAWFSLWGKIMKQVIFCTIFHVLAQHWLANYWGLQNREPNKGYYVSN